MSFLSKRSFNVKLVNDNQLVAGDEDGEKRNPVDGVLIAQAYAQIAVDTATSIAQIAVVTTAAIVGIKTTANLVNAGLKYWTK